MADDETKVAETETADTGKTEAPSQDNVKSELERVQKPTRSEAEIAKYNLAKAAERAKKVGIDPAELLIPKDEEPEDEIPDWYKREQAKTQSKTAIELADQIEDENERALVKKQLESVITSGSPEERLRVARGYVNSVKNGQIAAEAQRRTAPKATAAGGSQSAPIESEFQPTDAEAVMMRPPYNLSKEKILAARQANAEKR